MLTSHSRPIKRWVDSPVEAGRSATVSGVMGRIVVGIGLLVLIGWTAEIDVLKRVHRGTTPVNPLTAVALILLGCTILLARRGRWRFVYAMGTCTVLLALAKLASLVWAGLPVDQLLFASHLVNETGVRSTMAANTAVALALGSVAVILVATGRYRFGLLSQALSISVLASAMFALLGLAFHINPLTAVGPFIPMAPYTATALALASIGTLSLTPNWGLPLLLRSPGPAGSMARVVLPMAILTPVAVGTARFWGETHGYFSGETGVALSIVANILVTSTLLVLSIFALHRSDTVRLKRAEDLARSESSYRLAEQVAQVGHWRMDLPSLNVTWSDEVFRICGIAAKKGPPSAAEILDIYHPDDRRLVRQSVRDALRERLDWEYSVRLSRPDGEVRHVVSHGVCERDQSGNLTGIFGVFADVTELEDARRKAEAATSTKSAFLANMSHEIRTPLNGVMGFAELLLGSKLETEQKRHATLIFESAKTLLNLLNDILDVSKIDAGQLQIAREPFDLDHQLRQCVRLMQGMAQNKGLLLTLTVDPNLPQFVMGDSLRVRQILLNLLGNAIKFTAVGSVTVAADVAKSEAGDPVFEITVSDTGVGIAEADQATVFGQFVQADVSTARRYGGSGLGLSISRSLAGLMDGQITLSSREGEGTKVALSLPLASVVHPLRRHSDPSARALSDAPMQPAESSRRTILLAEDLDINQELIAEMLQRMGHAVEIAANGEEAIKLARKLLIEPDAYGLILMDIQMPIIDGIEATRAIRVLGGRAASIPIVALTANAFSSDVEMCRKAGMMDHLAKPVSIAALGSMLDRWLVHQEYPAERRHPSDASDTSDRTLADRFAQRKFTYARRLEELQCLLPNARDDAREHLVAEAKTISHNLAGSAAMFGEDKLGKVAANTEECLGAGGQGDRACLISLIEALR